MSNRPGREERKDGNNVRNNPPEPRGNRDMGALEREFENQAPRRAPPPQPRQQQQQQQQAPPNYVRMNADFAGVFPHQKTAVGALGFMAMNMHQRPTVLDFRNLLGLQQSFGTTQEFMNVLGRHGQMIPGSLNREVLTNSRQAVGLIRLNNRLKDVEEVRRFNNPQITQLRPNEQRELIDNILRVQRNQIQDANFDQLQERRAEVKKRVEHISEAMSKVLKRNENDYILKAGLKVLFSPATDNEMERLDKIREDYGNYADLKLVKEMFGIYLAQKFNSRFDAFNNRTDTTLVNAYNLNKQTNPAIEYNSTEYEFLKYFREKLIEAAQHAALDGIVTEKMLRGLDDNTIRNLMTKTENYMRQKRRPFSLDAFKIQNRKLNIWENPARVGNIATEANRKPNIKEKTKYVLGQMKPEFKTFFKALKAVDDLFSVSPELSFNILRQNVNSDITIERDRSLGGQNSEFQLIHYFPYSSVAMQREIRVVEDQDGEEQQQKEKLPPEFISIVNGYLKHVLDEEIIEIPDRAKDNINDREGALQTEYKLNPGGVQTSAASYKKIKDLLDEEFDEDVDLPNPNQAWNKWDRDDDIMLKLIVSKFRRDNPDNRFRMFQIILKLTYREYYQMCNNPKAIHKIIMDKLKEWRRAKNEEMNGLYGDEEDGNAEATNILNNAFLNDMTFHYIELKIRSKKRQVTRQIEPREFNFMVHCRGEFEKEFAILGPQATKCGICLYEAHWQIIKEVNHQLRHNIKKKQLHEIEKLVLMDFIKEDTEFKEACLMGNPITFYNYIKEKKPDWLKHYAIQIYENPDFGYFKEQKEDTPYVIMVRCGHATAILRDVWEKNKQNATLTGFIFGRSFNKRPEVLKQKKEFVWERNKKHQKKNIENGKKRKKMEGEESQRSEQVVRQPKKKTTTTFTLNLEEFYEDPVDFIQAGKTLVQKAKESKDSKFKVGDAQTANIKAFFGTIGKINPKGLKDDDDEDDDKGGDDDDGVVEQPEMQISTVKEHPTPSSTRAPSSSITLSLADQEIADFIHLNMDIYDFFYTKWDRNKRDGKYIDLALDIETFDDPVTKRTYPYCICITNISNPKQFIHIFGRDCDKKLLLWFEKTRLINRDHNMRDDYQGNTQHIVNIFTFNGSRFDLHILFKEMMKRFPCEVPNLSNLKTLVIHNVYFWDFRCIVSGSLKKVAKSFNVPFQKLDFDHTKVNEHNLEQIRLESTKYCLYDCFTLGACVDAYFEFTTTLGIKPYTISCSKMCFDYYLTKFYQNEWSITSIPEEHQAKVNQSYTGGVSSAFRLSNLDLDRVKWVLNNINFCRVKDALEIPLLDEETVKKLSKVDDKQNSWIMMQDGKMVDRENHDLFDGLKKILYEDLCSSYPYNMERYMIPSKLLSQTSGAGKKITYKNFKEYASIKSDSEDRKPEYARTLDPYAYLIGIRNFKFQPWVKIPTFQVKDQDGLLWYPLEYEGLQYYWGDEIAFAFERQLMQDEIEIIEILTFKLENLFSKYILELYDRRLKCKASGDKIGDLLFKLMMNGLYGKFGQKQYPTKKIVNTEQLNYILKTNNYLHVINDINEKKVAPRFRVNPANEGHIEDINYLGEQIYEVEFNFKDGISYKHVSSYITSLARRRLFNGMYSIFNWQMVERFANVREGKEENIQEFLDLVNQMFNDIYYCDTDSVVHQTELAANLRTTESVLGKFKVEKELVWFVTLGSKQYCHMDNDGIIECKGKGIPKEYLKPENYFRILEYHLSEDKTNLVSKIATDCGEFFRRDIGGMYKANVEKEFKMTCRRNFKIDGTSDPPRKVYELNI